MEKLINKFKKGKIIKVENNNIIEIVSDLIKFKEYYAIYADITNNVDFRNRACFTKKIDDKVALIIRNKELLKAMGLTAEERMSIYCHELGHNFSPNQQQKEKKDNTRSVADEIDSDTFAVKKCGISPEVLESALKKTYEYDIKHISEKKDITQEKLDTYINEMRARKRNVEQLIKEQSQVR